MPLANGPYAPEANKNLLPLDPSLYDLDENQRSFLKQVTGITDEEELKRHVIKVQAKAYKLFPYPCIRLFSFAKFAMSQLPCYQQALRLGRERESALLLDLGCCFGSDLRKIASDGWPAENMLASDVCAGFWECGHDLYKSTPESFPVAFVPGDAFDPSLISPGETLYSRPPTERPVDLMSLTSLNPLKGHLTAIHASLFFHLFDEDKQFDMAHRLAGLLSPEPGSMIFGGHYVRSEKCIKTEVLADGLEHTQFWHSPQSWRELWGDHVFKKGSVKVEAEWALNDLSYMEIARSGSIFYYMAWCVTRL